MPLVHTAQTSNTSPSATHPFGVGIGWQPVAKGRELTWAGKDDKGRLTFRDHTKGVGVLTHLSDDKGVFHLPIGILAHALTLKIDHPNNTWRIDRRVGPEEERAIDPTGLIGRERESVAFFVTGMLGADALRAGPSKVELRVEAGDRGYQFTELPRPTVCGEASRMDPSLPSAAGKISPEAPVKGRSPLGMRLASWTGDQ